MWLVQSGVLIELPDDAPVPPGSVPVEVPEEFFTEPDAFRIHQRGITRRPAEEIEAMRQQREAARLSKEEIALLKRAVAEGRL